MGPLKASRYVFGFGIILLALFTAIPGALAHDSWIQPNIAIAEVGDQVYLDLFLGNHGNHHRSYRIAGKLDPATITLTIYGPNGIVSDDSSTLVDYGEPDSTGPVGVKGYLGTVFVPETEGMYLAVVTAEDILQHGDTPRFRAFRTAKTYVAAVDGPRTNAAALTGWDHSIAPTGAELVPQRNPATVTAGDTISFRLLLRGEPLAGETVSVIRRLTGEYWDGVTDEEGLVAFSAPAADYYLVRAKIDREGEAVEGEYAKTSYEATFTFMAGRSSPAGR